MIDSNSKIKLFLSLFRYFSPSYVARSLRGLNAADHVDFWTKTSVSLLINNAYNKKQEE
jgi:hypothetical protein